MLSKRKRDIENGEAIRTAEERKYKDFAGTFKLSSFALGICMMYPKRSIESKRIGVQLVMLVTLLPALGMFLCELYDCISAGDLDNFTRQLTLVIPFCGIAIKMVLANIYRREFEIILDEISCDLMAANDFTEDYQAIIDQFIKSGRFGQNMWAIASVMVTGVFPITAMVLMVNHNTRNNEVKRFMVHEMSLSRLGERKYESPYFEITFAYFLYLILYFLANFTGFDGTFCITVNHGALKMKLMTHRLKKAFDDSTDVRNIKVQIKEVIVVHQRIYKYIGLLQKMYGTWLALVFILTLIQICMTLYQVTEVDSIDPKYLIFVVGSIQHIFMPCHFSAALKQTMIQTSYSLFTLLTSG